MKAAGVINVAVVLFASSIILAARGAGTSAQSGRARPTPTASEQATPPAQAQIDAPKFTINPAADRYKLIFPPGYEGKLWFTLEEAEDRAALEQTRRAHFDKFVEELNKAGTQGYRFVSTISGDITLLKLDETQYEYAWFETGSGTEDNKFGFTSLYGKLAGQGFRLVYHSNWFTYCDPDSDYFVRAWGAGCDHRDYYLLERVKGVEQAREYRLVYSPMRGAWAKGSPHVVELMDGLREWRAKGFYPTSLLSRFEVLVERLAEDKRPASEGDFQLARASSFWEADNLPKKMKELAAQGYRLSLVNHGIALMYREGANASPLTYVWLKPKDKKFEEQVAKLQASGAVYRMAYPDGNGLKTRVIFEQSQASGGPRREYRLLRFELYTEGDVAARKVRVEMLPSTQEMKRSLDALLREGFEPRDLLDLGYRKTPKLEGRESEALRYALLLERTH